ncbi:A-kinase anchor protein 5-like [Pseudophryne corroboree]|uniref:A-kinase anchor protein 5-like n=1 Tax=Pseudophryne corroboree TaxID=495146 RepID=UPI003081CF11
MSDCKATSSDAFQEEGELQSQPAYEKRPNNHSGKYITGYSSMVFHKKGKDKRKQSRSNPCNLSKDFKDSEKKNAIVVTKKCEVLGFEEVSNEFTCTSSIIESYSLNTNKEAKFSFRKLDDGTFALETKNSCELNQETGEPGIKRSTKSRHAKGRYSHKPLKICFKKRSKALKKSSDTNDDYKSEHKNLPSSVQEDITSIVNKQDECSHHDLTTGKPWATFKSLVTRRRKLRSSLKGQSQLSGGNLDANTSSTCIQRVSKTGRFSNLRIPCMNFSRGKKSTNITLPSEESLGVAKPSETFIEESTSDCQRSDKALAVKYKLQRSLDVENGKLSNSLDICSEKTPIFETNVDQNPENNDKMIEPNPIIELDVGSVNSAEERRNDCPLRECKSLSQSPNGKQELSSYKGSKHIKSIQETEGPKLSEDLSPKDDDKHTIQDNIRNYKNSLVDCEDGLNELSLTNDVSATVEPTSDLYEMLLMSTAVSLVNKVIKSSIQQLVEEEALLNHVQSKDSERFYI